MGLGGSVLAMGSTKISLTRWSSISLYTAMKVLVLPKLL